MHHATNDLGQPVGFPLPNWKPPAQPAREPMRGRFCCVEPLNPRLHAAALFTANTLDSADKTWTYLPYGPFATRDDYQAWTEEMCRGVDPLFYAITDIATDQAVGVASYLHINPWSGSIEIGHINYSPRLQRTSAATEAMYLMMEQVFRLGYRRYEWKCDALNASSRAAAQRLGFSFEGVFRQAAVVKGRNRDTAWYAVIDKEWPALQDAFRRWLAPANFDAQGMQRVQLSTLTSTLLAHP